MESLLAAPLPDNLLINSYVVAASNGSVSSVNSVTFRSPFFHRDGADQLMANPLDYSAVSWLQEATGVSSSDDFEGADSTAAMLAEERGLDSHSKDSSSSSSTHTGDLKNILWVFVGPVIFVVGLAGNALILYVMTRRRMRGTSTCVYLTLMAVADSMVLVTGMVTEWLEASSVVVVKELHPVACKLEKFLFYVSGDTAIWILVIFTVDRFIAVCFPLQKNKFCRSSRAKISSLVALLAAAIKNFHVFWTRGYEQTFNGNTTSWQSNCGRPTPAYKHFEEFIRPWIAFVFVSVIPFCTILLCNAFIIRALLKVRRMRSEHLIISSTGDKSLIQMTAMCLSASFCFLVCITPSIVLLIGKPFWAAPGRSAADKLEYDIAKTVNNLLVFVNHSVNFFLYCLTGRRFRQVVMCRKKKLKRTLWTDKKYATESAGGGAGSSETPESRSTVFKSPFTPSPTPPGGRVIDNRLRKGGRMTPPHYYDTTIMLHDVTAAGGVASGKKGVLTVKKASKSSGIFSTSAMVGVNKGSPTTSGNSGARSLLFETRL